MWRALSAMTGRRGESHHAAPLKRIFGNGLDQRQGNTGIIQKRPRILECLNDGSAGQSPHLCKCLLEPGFAVVGASLPLSVELRQPEPRRQRRFVALEARRVPVGDVRLPVLDLPG